MTRFSPSNEHRVSAEVNARRFANLDMEAAHGILGLPEASAVVEIAERDLLDWLATTDAKLGDEFVVDDFEHNGGYNSALAVRWAINAATAQGDTCFEFVREMAAKSIRPGLSVGQIRGVLNCMRAAAFREAREVEAETPIEELPFGEFSGLVSMLERMQANGLRHPKVSVETTDGTPVVLSIAGQRARQPGTLNVTDSRRFGGEFFGRISRAGEADTRLQRRDDVLDALRRLADDPESALATYGKRTGNCGICGRFLTNEESVDRGIGPICADKVGL